MSDSTLLKDFLAPLGDCLDAESARRLVEMRPDPAVDRRIAEFASKANEGELTEQERQDYEALVNAMDFVSILKIKARQRLHMTA